uniref:RP2 activator of ARL3 GTPase n=1 Tax=Acanthochromis polyacanthus TaxID=80966 RepID=A0A3Q1EUF1_9TELE
MQPLSCFCFSVKSHHLSTSFPHSSKTSQWVNLPGKLHRQQFVIQECEKCNMYVFNHSKTITINDCVISRIFLRLVKGSVFVRDCKHTKCVVMKVFLCCFYYPELAYHFKDAGLSMFNNNWSYIHHLILVSRRNNYHESEFKWNSEQSCLFVCFAGEYGTANTHEKRRECEEVLLVWQQQINLKEDMAVCKQLADDNTSFLFSYASISHTGEAVLDCHLIGRPY